MSEITVTVEEQEDGHHMVAYLGRLELRRIEIVEDPKKEAEDWMNFLCVVAGSRIASRVKWESDPIIGRGPS